MVTETKFLRNIQLVRPPASDASNELSDAKESNHVPRHVINNIQSKLLKNYIALRIGNIQTHALVDSGADICCAHPDVLTKYHLHIKGNVYPSEITHINTANGEKVYVQGVIYVKAEVAKRKVIAKCHLVPDLHSDFILGIDWLQAYNVCIKFGSGTLCLDPRRSITTCSKVTIPPKSEKIMVARIKGKPLPAGVVGMTSGSPFVKGIGLSTAGVLHQVRSDCTVLHRVINPTKDSVTIAKGRRAGKFTCASGQDRIFPFGRRENASKGTIPVADQTVAITTRVEPPTEANHPASPALPEMADHEPSGDIQFSNTNLTADQRSQLCALADEYRHLFVGPDGKLGKCDIVRHKIDVDPAQRSIKHRAYRLAPHQKDAMEKLLKDLEE